MSPDSKLWHLIFHPIYDCPIMIMITSAAIMSDSPIIVAPLKADNTDLPTSEYETTTEVRARPSITILLSISIHDSVSQRPSFPAQILISRFDISPCFFLLLECVHALAQRLYCRIARRFQSWNCRAREQQAICLARARYLEC